MTGKVGARQPNEQFFHKGDTIATPPGISSKPGRGIFYGWFIVGAAALVIFSSGPGQSFVFSVFLGSIIEDTGLSLTGATALLTASTAVSAVLVTIVSRLADRYGPRIMLVAGGLGLGAACFGMATATNILLFFVAFASLRALGQGSLIINCVLLVNQWFVSRRGRAIGMMTMGVVLSTATYPPVARFLIDSIGWREAYAVLGAVAIALIVPAALFVIKNRPEDVGLFPDGSSQPPVSETRQATPGVRRNPRVLTSASFWLVALSLGLPGLVNTGLIVHQTFVFQESGLSATVAAGVFPIYSAASAVSSLAGGFVADRLGPKALFVFSMAGLLAALALAAVMDSLFLAVAYVVVLGVSLGSFIIVHGMIWAYYYGRQGLGRVQGPAMTVSVCASAIGPLPLAVFHEQTGTYTVGILAMMVLPVVAAVGLIFARPGGTSRSEQLPSNADQPS